ncbi:MAG: hydroxyacylglutathione hydrolase family protein [Desulfobacterales bacterium]|nr:hydroxyacylglutathione hydrolase family protein [Desulfobacterales bacterium]
MDIEQFRYADDNLGYLVYTAKQGIAIDAGNPEAISGFARDRGIEIKYVTNTHSHQDHTFGNRMLLKKTRAAGALFLDCRSLDQGQVIELDGGQGLEVMLTPGHTADSVCFKGPGFVVTGDTLFNATVGNCFSGDLEGFYRSLKQLMALPGETLVYAGHDYVEESLAVAESIEPENSDIQVYRDTYSREPVVSCMADELKVNPYLRFNAPSMIRRLEERGMPRETGSQRFASLMEIY